MYGTFGPAMMPWSGAISRGVILATLPAHQARARALPQLTRAPWTAQSSVGLKGLPPLGNQQGRSF